MIIGFLYEAPSAETSETRKWTKMAAAGGFCLSIASLYQKTRRLWHLNAYFIPAVQSGESLFQAVKTFLWYVFTVEIFSGSAPDPVFFSELQVW